MSKSILISIKPKYVADILNGKKTVEIRKTYPKQLKGDGVTKPEPIDVYIYCTKGGEIFYKPLLENGKREYFIEKSRRNIKRLSNGVVVAKFTLNCVEPLTRENVQEYDMTFNDWRTKTLNAQQLHSKAYLTYWEMLAYLDNKQGYAWHIDNLEIFDEPKELSDFMPVKWDKCGVKDKNGLYQCHKCPYGEVLSYGGECHYEPLKRPPQSWCYVEEK